MLARFLLYYYPLMDLTDVLKALADTNRLRILNLLGEQTLCVCDLEEVLKLNQSNLSRHLAKLKLAGLVTAQKKGLFIYYSRKPLPPPYNEFVQDLYGAMVQQGEWEADRQALEQRASCAPVS